MTQANQKAYSYGKSNDIEMQNFSKYPTQNAADQKEGDSIKILIPAICILGTLFSTIYTCYNFFSLLPFDRDCLRIYLGDITDIPSLSPHARQLHESHYEALFNNTNNNMVNFDEVPKLNGEWPYIESFDYYKNYSYILQHQNLSLFINIPHFERNESDEIHEIPEIHATLIDRSVTNKTTKELYTEYKHYDARVYQNLQHRQPVHRAIPMPDLSRSNASSEQTKMNNHLWFLTDFVELFNPVFYHGGDRINSALISPENVNKLLVRATESDDTLHVTNFVFSIFLLCFYPVAMLPWFDRQGAGAAVFILLMISVLHFVVVVVAVTRPGVSEMKHLVALLFESQYSNIEISEVEQFNKIFTYHTVELISSLIMLFGMWLVVE